MKKILLTIFMASLFGLTVFVEPAFAVNAAQNKLLAKRAAQADALRNLAETVMGLQINAQTYVRDFVAESDQIRTELNTFLKGASITNVFYLPDGTCEVTVSMPIQRIIQELKTIHRARYVYIKGRRRWRLRDFDQIVVNHPQMTLITAKGSGVPRPGYPTASAASGFPASDGLPQESIVTSNIPGWEGVTSQGRLMAERAALTDAYRNLAETVKGLRITSNTYVRDFVAESDQINTMLNTFIKNIRQASPYRFTPEGICEVDVEVSVQEVIKQLIYIRQKIVERGWGWRRTIFQDVPFEQIIGQTPLRIIRATGSGVPPDKYRINAVPTQAYVPNVPTAPSWVSSIARATGTGIPPQGVSAAESQLMAERAAKMDALRNLTEQVYGVQITATTTVRDFVTQHDQVTAQVSTFLQGAREVAKRQLSDGSIEVDVELSLNGLYQIVKPLI